MNLLLNIAVVSALSCVHERQTSQKADSHSVALSRTLTLESCATAFVADLGWAGHNQDLDAGGHAAGNLDVSFALQAAIVAIIAATLFLRTHLHPNSIAEGQLYSGFLFFSLLQMFFSGIAEMTFAVSPFYCCLSVCVYSMYMYVLVSVYVLPVVQMLSLIYSCHYIMLWHSKYVCTSSI